MLSLSITMSGVSTCTGGCSYCSAALSQNYGLVGPALKAVYTDDSKLKKWVEHVDDKTYKQFEIDSLAFKKCLLNNRNYQRESRQKKPVVHIDLWGANPLSCRKALVETIEMIQEVFRGWEIKLTTSDNGIGIYTSYDLIEKYNLDLQLSHDGIGEWIRLPIDPLYEEPFKSAIEKALKTRHLTSINATLSRYNNSFYKNMRYFNDYFNKIKLDDQIRRALYIKLNHVYDSDYDIKAINTEGRWQDTTIEELKGKPIGKWQLFNGNNDYDRHVLDDYIEEYIKLGIQMRDDTINSRLDFAPFRAYIMEQTQRKTFFKDHDSKHAACRSFQRYKHKIGDAKGWDDQTFVITTIGEYSECNLIDSHHTTENPGGEQPDYCQGCKYEFFEECNGCGSMKLPSECNYLYRHAEANMFFMYLDQMVTNRLNSYKNQVIKRILG